MWAPLGVPAAPLPIQLLSHAPGKAGGADSSSSVPVTPMRDPHDVPGSCFQPDPALAIVAICEANQWMEDFFPVSLCLSNK